MTLLGKFCEMRGTTVVTLSHWKIVEIRVIVRYKKGY